MKSVKINVQGRKRIRLRSFDYSSPGAYFITICTKLENCFFGKINEGKLFHNEVGKIADENMADIPNHYPTAELDVVMPNHIHCILNLHRIPLLGVDSLKSDNVETDQIVTQHRNIKSAGTFCDETTKRNREDQYNQFSKPVSGSISTIMNQYKGSVTKWCNNNGHQYFGWQSRFHDHVIRNPEEYERIREYIISNPANWRKEKFYREVF